MLVAPAALFRQPLQNTCGNTPIHQRGATLAECTTVTPERSRTAVKRKLGDFHAKNRRCCCSNEACKNLGSGPNSEFVWLPGLKKGETPQTTSARAYQMLLVLKEGDVSEVEISLNKTRKHSIRRTHFNLATDFKYHKLMTRLLPKACATFQLQLQLPLPSPPPTFPAQQPMQQQQGQQDQEGLETQQEDGTVAVLQSDALAKRLAAFYAIHNPRKLLDPSFVIDCANRYQDEPDQLEQILVRHYQVGLHSSTEQQEHQEPQEDQEHQAHQQQPPSTTASPPCTFRICTCYMYVCFLLVA